MLSKCKVNGSKCNLYVFIYIHTTIYIHTIPITYKSLYIHGKMVETRCEYTIYTIHHRSYYRQLTALTTTNQVP